MTKLPKGTCRCGNTVLLFKRGDETQGTSNAPDSDRLTYHDDLAGAAVRRRRRRKGESAVCRARMHI